MKKYRGVWIGDEYDIEILAEVRGYFRMLEDFSLSLKGSVVLDVGAHRGFFSRLALDAGARIVVAIEPEVGNFRILKKNAPEAICLEGALIGWREEKVPLTISKVAKHTTQCSVVRRRDGRAVILGWVKAFYFSDVLRTYRPNVIKLDCQGAEWSFFQTPLPKYVKFLFGEIHYSGRFLLNKEERMKSSPLKSKAATEGLLEILHSEFDTYFKRGGRWHKSLPYKSAMWHQDFVFVRRRS